MANNYLCRIRLDRPNLKEGKGEETERFYIRLTDVELDETGIKNKLKELKEKIDGLKNKIDELKKSDITDKTFKENMLNEAEKKLEEAEKEYNIYSNAPTCEKLNKFLDFVFNGTSSVQAKVKAVNNYLTIKDSLSPQIEQTETVDNAESDGPTQVTEFLGNACECPICGEVYITKEKLEGNFVKTVDDKKLKVLNIDEHIKKCSKCNFYYCDGDGKEESKHDYKIEVVNPENETETKKTQMVKYGNEEVRDEANLYSTYETYADHYNKHGHLPEEESKDTEPTKVKKEAITGQSLIAKFKIAAYTLDGKKYNDENFAEKLNSYIKTYTTETTYLSYKYEVSEDNGGYVLRCKIEFSPAEYFLNRSNEYKFEEVIDEEGKVKLGLEEAIDQFLSFTKATDTETDKEDTTNNEGSSGEENNGGMIQQ